MLNLKQNKYVMLKATGAIIIFDAFVLFKKNRHQLYTPRARFTLHRRRPPPVYICCLHSVQASLYVLLLTYQKQQSSQTLA